MPFSTEARTLLWIFNVYQKRGKGREGIQANLGAKNHKCSKTEREQMGRAWDRLPKQGETEARREEGAQFEWQEKIKKEGVIFLIFEKSQ